MNQTDDLKLKRAVQLLCSTGIRRPMSMEKIKIWLKQFDPGPEQTLALLILRHLIYRTTDQIESSLIQALRRMTLHFAANCWRALKFDQPCALNIDQALSY
jgi:hypothetical protein